MELHDAQVLMWRLPQKIIKKMELRFGGILELERLCGVGSLWPKAL